MSGSEGGVRKPAAVRRWAPTLLLEGSNEIAVIPELLRTLELAGALVTIDAAGCQVENARLIRAGGGHYVLAVKGNQPALQEAVQAVFERAREDDFAGLRCDSHASVEDGHGRHEERYVTVIYDPVGLPADWPEVAAVVQVGRERQVDGKNVSTLYCAPRTGHENGLGELDGLMILNRFWKPEDGSQHRPSGFPSFGGNLSIGSRLALSQPPRDFLVVFTRHDASNSAGVT
jgi:predicted transposase YbfD/YdcC